MAGMQMFKMRMCFDGKDQSVSGAEQLKELVCKLPVTKISPNGQGLIPCLCSGRGKAGLVFIASCRERLLLPFFFFPWSGVY